jgi:hypothetical protein
MATYMNQYDLAEVQAAIGSVDVAAFQGIRVDQVSELILDEQSQKALQNYVAIVSELSKDIENGYESNVNININDFVITLSKKKEEIYAVMAAESDPEFLMMIDSYRWAEAMSERKDEETYNRLAVANILHDAMIAQGVEKEINAKNAATNVNAMLIGFDYAMAHGAQISESEINEQFNNLMITHFAQAVKNGDDLAKMAFEMTAATEKSVHDSKFLSSELIANAISSSHELLERVGNNNDWSRYKESILNSDMLTDAKEFLRSFEAAKNKEHENEKFASTVHENESNLEL